MRIIRSENKRKKAETNVEKKQTRRELTQEKVQRLEKSLRII